MNTLNFKVDNGGVGITVTIVVYLLYKLKHPLCLDRNGK